MRLRPSITLAVVLLSIAAALPAASPDPVYSALRQAVIADGLLVENIVIKRDVGTLTLKSGALGFTAPAMGRDTVAVFVGEGEFVFAPEAPIDKNYLKSITGQETITEAFDRALFCFTDAAGKELRAQGKTQPADAKLNDALREYRNKLRDSPDTTRSATKAMLTSESMDNVEADILADLYNAGQPGFFNAYLHGRKHGELRFYVRPRGAMPDLPAPEEVAVINTEEGDEDGIWYLGHLRSEMAAGKASSQEDKRAVQAESYRIETEIAGNDRLAAKAEFRFRGVNAGDRVVKFGLVPSLRVTRVLSGDKEVPFIQEDRKADGSFHVVMPEPMERGREYALTIEYAGDRVLRKAGGGNLSVGARTSWYPSVNSFMDRARYDLTFRVPKRYKLVSVGKLVKESKEKDVAVSQWVSEIPLAVAGFNCGEYEKKENNDPQSGVVIEGYANPTLPDSLRQYQDQVTGMSPTRMNENTMVEAINAVRVYNTYFGKSEFPRIALTQQPAFSYGQSWPTLIYLPISAYLDSTQRWQLMGGISKSLTDFVAEVTPHEVSHQWWGHMVGSQTHHDEWLSEGFATFSAGLYLQLTEKNSDRYLAYWNDARKRILEKNEFGRRSNDAGPVWLGLRLSTAKNEMAYNTLVYDKGGYVLHMLRQMMWDAKEGDKPFMAMMQEFVRENMNKNVTTEQFQRIAEKHVRPSMDLAGNGKLDWFFSQWVYGTDIPRYKLDVNLTPQADGKCLVDGALTQSEVPAGFGMVVPLYAEFEGGQIVKLGAAKMIGASSMPLKLTLPKKPKRVMINAYRDVLEAE